MIIVPEYSHVKREKKLARKEIKKIPGYSPLKDSKFHTRV